MSGRKFKIVDEDGNTYEPDENTTLELDGGIPRIVVQSGEYDCAFGYLKKIDDSKQANLNPEQDIIQA